MWEAYLFKVATGDIGPRLNYESATWSTSLNDTESLSFKLRKSDLPKVDLNYWLAPWWAGVVYMYNGIPIVAGPIISRPTESFNNIDIACAGIRSVLARRYVTAELSNWAQLAASNITYKGMSLGTIAQEVVKQAQNKAGGKLPISYPVPPQYVSTFAALKTTLPACQFEDGNPDGSDCFWDASVQGNQTGTSFAIINGRVVYDTVDAAHTRTYKGFNIQNINADDILTKLSNVIDGPDVMFRPRLTSTYNLTFDMLHGSENQPRIPQNAVPVWDITAESGNVTNMQITMTGAYQTFRVYSLGAGQDSKRLIRVVTNLDGPSKGFPLLESDINAGNSENSTVVYNHAVANLKANVNPIYEIQFEVRADGSFPVSQFYPGMVVKLVVKGMLGMHDGTHDAILLNMNGGSDQNIKLSLQSLSRYLIDDKTTEE